jgi:Ala-tRNA(Pro) deacylase
MDEMEQNGMSTAGQVYAFLDRLGVCYRRVSHPPAATMEDCRAVDLLLGCAMCKNLFLCNRTATDFYLLLMPADKPFKTKELSSQIGSSRLSFASGEAMEKYLGCAPGSASVLGLLFDEEKKVRLLVDRDLLMEEKIGCHPAVNTASVALRVADLTERILPALGREPTYVTLTGRP